MLWAAFIGFAIMERRKMSYTILKNIFQAVDKQTRYKRAEALRIIGFIYKHVEENKPTTELVVKIKGKQIIENNY